MADVPIGAAIERAREALSLEKGIPERAAYVARLDRTGAGYYLVWFGAANATTGVAAVDAASGEVLSRARLPGSRALLPVTAEAASRRAGAAGAVIPRLVWRPCRASFSMLLPFWQVPIPPRPVYVDQQGHLWTELEAGGPG